MTSFITIGGIWLAHHGIFRLLTSADRMVMRLNILLLMLVAFLPLPTKLMGEAINWTTEAERAAVIFYGLILLAISSVTGILWRHMAQHRELLDPEVTDDEINAMTNLTTPSIDFSVAAVVVAILAPQVAAVGYLLIAVIAVFRQRGDRTTASARG